MSSIICMYISFYVFYLMHWIICIYLYVLNLYSLHFYSCFFPLCVLLYALIIFVLSKPESSANSDHILRKLFWSKLSFKGSHFPSHLITWVLNSLVFLELFDMLWLRWKRNNVRNVKNCKNVKSKSNFTINWKFWRLLFEVCWRKLNQMLQVG